jgi:hypothetical protein
MMLKKVQVEKNLHIILNRIPQSMKKFPISIKFVFVDLGHTALSEPFKFIHLDEVLSLLRCFNKDEYFELRLFYTNGIKKKGMITYEYMLDDSFRWIQVQSGKFVEQTKKEECKKVSLLDININELTSPVNLVKRNQNIWTPDEIY